MRIFKPMVMGTLMGLMMLGMVHLMLTGESNLAGAALAMFVGAHVVIVAAVLLLGLVAARLSPGAQRLLARVHKPKPRHAAQMVASAVGVAALIHLIVHGGL